MTSIEFSGCLDSDILFNPPVWNDLAETQRRLFNPQALINISDRIRAEFYNGHAIGRDMPVIAPEDWATTLLKPYANGTIGYDLPCLLSADRPARGRIMMCAQDPLRKPGEAKLTVGTFFGIDSDYLRTRRHYWMIWQLIRKCIFAGYDVWVTDAIKVFAGPNVLRKNTSLRELCYSVILEEVDSFRPDKILTFGKEARLAMEKAGVATEITSVAHPTARGMKGPFKDRISLYYQAMFGAETAF
ncbi:hypothetical protein D2T31_20545 [Sinirhodobacter populi]|uniref:Uracil-DNA glycosylase n=1 Tax=Paenirhodobacter populi TaxID=2306993 RepID=A0A443K0N1_9RHOB|nr:hypothetical protein [Sinirhodobacter populi]RWR26275.1 hypothetical protein D2T31_20545 [Sinirhodobacter populi]